MAIRVRGVVRGRHIDLETDPGFPDGATVEVTVSEESREVAERRERLLALSGAWGDDDSILPIFDEIIRARSESMPRESGFDAAS